MISRMPNSVLESSLTAPFDLELHGERIEIRLAHLCGPPQARIGEDELLKFVRREGDVFRFVGSEFDILLELDGFDLAFQLAASALYPCRSSIAQSR